MTTWGSTVNHLRVGVDVSMSPSTVTSSTTSVTLTWRVVVQTVQWYYADGQVATLSGAVSASKSYRKDDPQKTGTYDTVVGTWTSTVAPSTATPITRSLNVVISDVVGGGSPQVSASFTVPAKPAPAPVGDATTPAPSTPAPAVGTSVTLKVDPSLSGGLPVYSGPALTYSKVGTLASGSSVTGVVSGDWLQITSPSTYGGKWVQTARLVAPTATDTSTTPAPMPGQPPVYPTVPAYAPGESMPDSVDLICTPGVQIYGDGSYDAFVWTAGRDGGETILSTWRHAKGHADGTGAKVMLSMSTDGGKSYSVPWAVPFVVPAQQSAAPCGLAWDEKNKCWVMLVMWSTTDAGGAVIQRQSKLHTSTDDGLTWSEGKLLDTSAATWFYPNDLAIDGSSIIAVGYGPVPGDSSGWRVLTLFSPDSGKTWTPVAPVKGLPSGNYSEARVTKLHSGAWTMLLRSPTLEVSIHRAVSNDGGRTWAYAGLVIPGMIGNPAVVTLADGSLLTILRNLLVDAGGRYVVDDTHGKWAWAWSVDGGATWVVYDAFADRTRYNMYGGLVPLAGGGAAVVYASEDDPTQLWKSSSVYFARFVTPELGLDLSWVGAVPVVEVTTADRIPVTRVWTNPRTGEEEEDIVRARSLDGFLARDFEVQQGQTVTYTARGRATEPVTMPILPKPILIHPLEPERLSMPIDIVNDGDRTHELDANVVGIPGSDYYTVTKSGQRKAPKGETTFRTTTLVEEAHVMELFHDGVPLFLSAHPGMGFPDWIQPLDLKEARVVQMCAHSDRDDHVGGWRHWTFSWVAVKRPSAAALPIRRRYRDIPQPIYTLPVPIGDI